MILYGGFRISLRSNEVGLQTTSTGLQAEQGFDKLRRTTSKAHHQRMPYTPHCQTLVLPVAVWDVFWADVTITFLGHIGCTFLSFVQKQRK